MGEADWQLQPVLDLWQRSNGPVHSSLPSAWSIFATINALQIAHLLHTAQRSTDPSRRFTTAQTIALPLIAVYSGIIVAYALLALPSPLLFSFAAVVQLSSLLIRYTPLSAILDSLPRLPSQLIFTLVDALGRSFAVGPLAVDAVLKHPNPGISGSPFAMLATGTLIAGGGALVLPVFNALSVDWRLQQPPWARGELELDLWTCTVATAVYAALMDAHAVFTPIRSAFELLPGFDCSDLCSEQAQIVTALVLVLLLGVGRAIAACQPTTLSEPKRIKEKSL